MTPPRRALALLPLDDRPCCARFPVRLAAMAGAELRLPPRQLLGSYLDPGAPDQLLPWLSRHLPQLEGALVSLDMLCWGGLVASRRPEGELGEARARLLELSEIPGGGPLWAFSSITRPAPTQTTIEEVALAARLTELSIWWAREAAGHPEAADRASALAQALPPQAVARYRQTRQRNFELNLAALEVAARRPWAHLLLGMDDSRTEGLNVMEARTLAQQALARGAPCTVAPGTDEMAMLLLTRALSPGAALTVRWSRDSMRGRITRYEDRPLEAVVEAQARAAGLELREGSPRQVWVYGPRGAQPEASGQTRLRRSRRAARFVEELVREVNRGARIAVADVSRANGADRALVHELLESGVFPKLAGYAGWNTSGNTLGTALATAALVPERATPDSERHRLAFLVERLADDWLYQSEIRQAISVPLGGSFVQLQGERLARTRRWVQELLSQRVRRIWRQHFHGHPSVPSATGLASLQVDLPWPRTFEVTVEVCLRRPPSSPDESSHGGDRD